MALFGRKDKKEKAAKDAAKASTLVESKAPSLKSVKVPEKNSAVPTQVKPVAKTASASKSAPTKAATPKKASTSAPKTAKAPVKKAPSINPAIKQGAPAKAPSVERAKKAPSPAPSAIKDAVAPTRTQPFFVATEEDIRLAFDEAIQEAEQEILRSGMKAVGKYEFTLEVDGFHFYLIANNGQMLFDSPSFTTLIGAINGVKTFKKTVAEGKFEVKVDKYNRYRFILARKYYGENYTTRDQCVKSVESVKNFASNAKIIRYTPTKEDIRNYEAARNSKRSPDDIDWRAVAKAEAEAPRMGKFEIYIEDPTHYCFYLIANNGQVLYSSRYYANEKSCRSGIDSFKRAAYVGNFFVDRDKFGNYRYVLKNIGSAPAFIGESYDNKPQCEKIIDSVKKFIVSATIEVDA